VRIVTGDAERDGDASGTVAKGATGGPGGTGTDKTTVDVGAAPAAGDGQRQRES
jgi:hypothetical protein